MTYEIPGKILPAEISIALIMMTSVRTEKLVTLMQKPWNMRSRIWREKTVCMSLALNMPPAITKSTDAATTNQDNHARSDDFVSGMNSRPVTAINAKAMEIQRTCLFNKTPSSVDSSLPERTIRPATNAELNRRSPTSDSSMIHHQELVVASSSLAIAGDSVAIQFIHRPPGNAVRSSPLSR